MKLCILTLCFAAASFAQSQTSTYTTDINGNRVEFRNESSTDGTRTERVQSINGGSVPLETTQEKVLKDGPDGRLVERITTKYDATGRQTSTERVVSEEQKLGGGNTVVHETTYRSDINGRMAEAERRTVETRVAGNVTTTDTSIARPSINGTFETAEKRSLVTEDQGADRQQASETVLRRNSDNQFTEALRQTTVTTKSGGITTEQSAVYEPGMAGQLELARQTVSSTSRRPDGTEVTEVNLYARSAPGRAQSPDASQQIKEQQIIERKVRADGSTVETLSVRRPSVSDPNRLGEARQLYETVCEGKCSGPKK